MRMRGLFAAVKTGLQATASWLITSPLAQAFATSDRGDAVTNTIDQGYSNVPVFINYIAYIGGAIVGVIGFGKLRNHFARPD